MAQNDCPFGWKQDPSESGGFIRDPMQSEEHRPREGMWVKIDGLKETQDLNGAFVQITNLCAGEDREKTHCQIDLDGEKFMIGHDNLIPLPGSSQRAPFHEGWMPQVELMVNGINCDGCANSLKGVLKAIEGVHGIVIPGTAASTGGHPNLITVKGVSLESVKNAIATLDNGRNKFTVAD